jgi:hypothetical protein
MAPAQATGNDVAQATGNDAANIEHMPPVSRGKRSRLPQGILYHGQYSLMVTS